MKKGFLNGRSRILMFAAAMILLFGIVFFGILQKNVSAKKNELAALQAELEQIEEDNSNISYQLNVEELSDIAHVTKPYFIKLFKHEFGISPIQYINGKKVERAQLLLFTTNMTIKEVAYTLGFSDQNYFIRMFRKLTGTTPQEYRRRLKS